MAKIIGQPGHFQPGLDTNHFLGLCDECDCHYLVRMTRAEVEDWGPFSGTRGKVGAVRQALFEAYMHVWATGAPRFGSTDGWEREPEDPEVIELVSMLRAAGERYQAERAR